MVNFAWVEGSQESQVPSIARDLKRGVMNEAYGGDTLISYCCSQTLASARFLFKTLHPARSSGQTKCRA